MMKTILSVSSSDSTHLLLSGIIKAPIIKALNEREALFLLASDKDKNIAAVFTEIYSVYGTACYCAEQEAIKNIAASLLDVDLDSEDNLRIIRNIKKLRPDVKVFVYTAQSEKTKEAAIAAGADEYIQMMIGCESSPENIKQLAAEAVGN